MATAKLALTDLTGSANQYVPANENFIKLDAMSSLRVIATQNAPPGSPAAGDTYIVGAAGSDAFSGHNNAIAIYNGTGWLFVTPTDGMVAHDVTAQELVAYGLAQTTWYPVQERWSATEHWTGRYQGGTASTNKVWSKSFSFALPNNTTQNTAHSISSLSVAAGGYLTVQGSASNGTTFFHFPLLSSTTLCVLKVDATNIVSITNFDASAYTAQLRLCYRKTV